MSNDNSTTNFVLSANTSNSASATPTSSSSPPLPLNCDSQQININGNGISNDGKLTLNNYHQNGMLSDLQTTFHGSSWSNIMDPLSGTSSGDHSFDLHNGNRMFEPQTTSPTPLMTMQQRLSYQQVKKIFLNNEKTNNGFFYFLHFSRQYNDDQ